MCVKGRDCVTRECNMSASPRHRAEASDWLSSRSSGDEFILTSWGVASSVPVLWGGNMKINWGFSCVVPLTLTSRNWGHFCLETRYDVFSQPSASQGWWEVNATAHWHDLPFFFTTVMSWLQASTLDAVLLSKTTDCLRKAKGNSTHHNPVSTTSGKGKTTFSAALGAFHLPQGIIGGLWWGRQLLQMEPQTLPVQGNYSRIPASRHAPKKTPINT